MNEYDHDPILGYYDENDVDNTESKLGPYRPLHPVREATTMGLFIALIGYGIYAIIKTVF